MASADPISGFVDALASLGGDIANWVQQPGRDAKADAATNQAVANYAGIPLPVLQQLQAQQVGPSAAGAASADPALMGDAYQGLGQLQNIADSGGATLADRANLEQNLNEAAQRSLAQRQAITNLLARQGQNPGAVGAALQLGAAKDQQQTSANVGLQNAAQMQQRAYQAVVDRARQAAQLQQQQFGQNYQKGAAQDAINQYNANARASAQRYNAGLAQQQFGNQMTKANGENGALQNQANYYQQQGARNAQQTANTAGGVGKLGSGIVQWAGSGANGGGAAGPTTDYGSIAQAPTQLPEEQ